jgi:hypothetical protein
MERSEYEAKKRVLEDQRREAIALIQAGFDAQLRALDMVWMGPPTSRPPVAVASEAPQPVQLAAPPAAPPAPPAPAPRKRIWGAAELYNRVLDLLPSLTEPFDRDDVMAALPERPKRSSLYHVLQDLQMDGMIELVQAGRGKTPSTYRRKAASPAPAGEG